MSVRANMPSVVSLGALMSLWGQTCGIALNIFDYLRVFFCHAGTSIEQVLNKCAKHISSNAARAAHQHSDIESVKRVWTQGVNRLRKSLSSESCMCAFCLCWKILASSSYPPLCCTSLHVRSAGFERFALRPVASTVSTMSEDIVLEARPSKVEVVWTSSYLQIRSRCLFLRI